MKKYIIRLCNGVKAKRNAWEIAQALCFADAGAKYSDDTLLTLDEWSVCGLKRLENRKGRKESAGV